MYMDDLCFYMNYVQFLVSYGVSSPYWQHTATDNLPGRQSCWMQVPDIGGCSSCFDRTL